MIEPISALAAPLMPFLDLLRPSKSPYVLVAVALLVCLIAPENAVFEGAKGWMYHAPFYAVVFLLTLLSFLYVPPESQQALEAEANGEKIQNGSGLDDIDVDYQMKFSRAFCLIMGLVSLYIFIDIKVAATNPVFLLVYLTTLVHLIIFSAFLVFRTIKEDSIKNFGLFQIGFITGLTILGIALSADSIEFSDKSVFRDCTAIYQIDRTSPDNIDASLLNGSTLAEMIEFGQVFETTRREDCAGQPEIVSGGYYYLLQEIETLRDWHAVNLLVFFANWLCYTLFWSYRLIRIVRITVV